MDFSCIECGGELPVSLVSDSRCPHCLFGGEQVLYCDACGDEKAPNGDDLCDSCIELLDTGAPFCEACGEQLITEDSECDNCGVDLYGSNEDG